MVACVCMCVRLEFADGMMEVQVAAVGRKVGEGNTTASVESSRTC